MPNRDNKNQNVRKQEGLRLSLEKICIVYISRAEQKSRYPDNKKDCLSGKGKEDEWSPRSFSKTSTHMTEAQKENIMHLRTRKNVFLAITALLLALIIIGIWQRFISRAPTPTTSIIVLQGAVYYRIHPEVADVFGKV